MDRRNKGNERVKTEWTGDVKRVEGSIYKRRAEVIHRQVMPSRSRAVKTFAIGDRGMELAQDTSMVVIISRLTGSGRSDSTGHARTSDTRASEVRMTDGTRSTATGPAAGAAGEPAGRSGERTGRRRIGGG